MKLHAIVPVLLLGVAGSLKAGDDFTCPVTKPTPVTFQAAGTFAAHKTSLFGTEKLFTLFPGNWRTTQITDRRFRVPKIVWGSETFDLRQERTKSSLTITGRRLDAAAGPLVFGGTHTAWIGDEASPRPRFFVTSPGAGPRKLR